MDPFSIEGSQDTPEHLSKEENSIWGDVIRLLMSSELYSNAIEWLLIGPFLYISGPKRIFMTPSGFTGPSNHNNRVLTLEFKIWLFRIRRFWKD